MLKPRDVLVDTVEKAISLNIEVSNSDNAADLAFQIADNHKIPIEVSLDYLTGSRSLNEASDFLLYSLLEAVNEDLVKDFFTDKEIREYGKKKYDEPEIHFPIEFNVVQISNDQWIGSISAQELKLFRDTQMIEYNSNTQRTMTRITVAGEEHYKITINRKAVEGIKNSYLKNVYIPNTITLAMPENTSFEYYENEKVLTINSLDHFDIIDGYHRYVGLSEIFNDNPDFDYPMELRLVSYSEKKAKQFIWQEDQKTKMSKMDSATFNQYKVSNIIVQRLNSGILNGEANKNGGIIDAAVLTNVLDYTFAMNKNNLTRSEEIKLSKEVETAFENLLDNDNYIFDKKWDRIFTICVVFALYNGCFDSKKIKALYDNGKDVISQKLNMRDISRLQEVWNHV